MENRILALDEVMALENGSRVWVENGKGWEHWDGVHVAERNASGLTWLIMEGAPGAWPASCDKDHLNDWFRVWTVPQPPTPEELEANPWGVPNAIHP